MGISKLIRSISERKTVPHEPGDTVKTGGVCAVLDHPQQGERITAPHYTFRVGTSGEIERVEISINKGPWQPCRNSAGYWWYDWSGYTDGRYQAVARARAKNNQVFTSEPSKFQVVAGRTGSSQNA